MLIDKREIYHLFQVFRCFSCKRLFVFPPNVPLKAMADRVIDGYIHFLRNFQIKSYANSTLGGNNAIKIVYSYADLKNNSSFMATDIATMKNDKLYVIQYYAQ